MDKELTKIADELLHRIGAKVETDDKVRKFTVVLPSSVYTLFRIKATLNEITLQDGFVEAVMDYIRK